MPTLTYDLVIYQNKITENNILTNCLTGVRVLVMVFNTTFNNISVISWCSVLLVEETGVVLWIKVMNPLCFHQ
jgi:hypothetical protein